MLVRSIARTPEPSAATEHLNADVTQSSIPGNEAEYVETCRAGDHFLCGAQHDVMPPLSQVYVRHPPVEGYQRTPPPTAGSSSR
jgi:hypothetical protein